MPNTSFPFVGCTKRDSGRAFLEYDVEAEPNDAMLSVSLYKRTPAEGGLDESVADGGTESGTLDSGDSPSSYFRAKKLLSSPSSSGELASASVVFCLESPPRDRFWRTRVTGVSAGSCD